MSPSLEQLHRQRAVLRARSRIERAHLAASAQSMLRPVAVADRASQAVQRLLSRPIWLLLMAGVAAAVGPRRLVAWSGPLMTGWRLWRGLKDTLRS